MSVLFEVIKGKNKKSGMKNKTKIFLFGYFCLITYFLYLFELNPHPEFSTRFCQKIRKKSAVKRRIDIYKIQEEIKIRTNNK